MGLRDLFHKHESLVAVDIGSHSIKLIELDTTTDKPRLVNVGLVYLPPDVFSTNAIAKIEKVAEQVGTLLETNGIVGRRAVTALPAPAVFTKRIKMPKMDIDELGENVQLEAANFIPHNVNAVKLDFHVIGEVGNQLEVLVVAVKDEIIDSFLKALSTAGLETGVVDVDFFALQNIFELAYPDLAKKTVALVNIGARYTSINICNDGQSLFTGDISVGGKLFTDSICEGMGVGVEDAEKYKKSKDTHSAIKAALDDILDRNIDYVASELNRQLSFFWNASGADESIEKIFLCGGGALVAGLKEELAEKTGLECEFLDPLRGIECGSNFDRTYLTDIAPLAAISLGLGLRAPGDKIIPEFDEDD